MPKALDPLLKEKVQIRFTFLYLSICGWEESMPSFSASAQFDNQLGE
jgi:hypothetical protein